MRDHTDHSIKHEVSRVVFVIVMALVVIVVLVNGDSKSVSDCVS